MNHKRQKCSLLENWEYMRKLRGAKLNDDKKSLNSQATFFFYLVS